MIDKNWKLIGGFRTILNLFKPLISDIKFKLKLELKPTTENIPNDINCRGKFYEYIHY